jgi:hypothetical protein
MWILLALAFATSVVANDNLRVAYQWKQIDFEYPNIDERQLAITNETFIQENVMPVGIEVYKNRLFVTLPRWKKGVPASLAYIDLNGKNLRLFFCVCVCDGSRAMLLQHHKNIIWTTRASLYRRIVPAHHKLSLSFCCRRLFFAAASRGFFLIVKLNHANETVVGFYIKSDIMNREKNRLRWFFEFLSL